MSMGQPELDSVGEAVLDSYGRCLKTQVRFNSTYISVLGMMNGI